MPSIATLVGNYDDPRSVGSILRRRRAAPLMRLIERTHAEKGHCRILDLGGTESYWNIADAGLLQRLGCRITLLNVAAGPVRNELLFDRCVGNATAVDCDDGAFDVVHANSVIEHVGDWRRMRMFSAEVRRLAPRYFIQTPNYWFPWEPHFGMLGFHYLPRSSRAALLLRKPRGFFARCPDISAALEALESVSLLDARMLAYLFPDGRLLRERMLGLTKSLIAMRE